MKEVSVSDILHVLNFGTIDVEGLLPWSSNYAFLIQICGALPDEAEVLELRAVYKPQRGERPLWDFQTGTLCNRERAAFLVSEALGWHLVPPTVLRSGPNGLGTMQLFIPHDPERHYFTIEGNPLYRQQLQKFVLFDWLINNADRKGGHILIEDAEDASQPERLWGIDHGISFHSDYKLRTVIWEFSGQSIPQTCLKDLVHFQEALATNQGAIRATLSELLSQQEMNALHARLDRVIRNKKFIEPGSGRHYPWPPV